MFFNFKKCFKSKLYIFPLCLLFSSKILTIGFSAGTQIKTPSGLKPIENIREGNEIIVFNEKQQVSLNEKVENVETKQTKTCTSIQVLRECPTKGISELTINCDSDQKFYCQKDGSNETFEWVQASNLSSGKYKLLATDGKTLFFDKIVKVTNNVPLEKEYLVYLELVENKTYIITENGYIVYNFNWTIPYSPEFMKLTEELKKKNQ